MTLDTHSADCAHTSCISSQYLGGGGGGPRGGGGPLMFGGGGGGLMLRGGGGGGAPLMGGRPPKNRNQNSYVRLTSQYEYKQKKSQKGIHMCTIIQSIVISNWSKQCNYCYWSKFSTIRAYRMFRKMCNFTQTHFFIHLLQNY